MPEYKRFKLDNFDSMREMLELLDTQRLVISDMEAKNEQFKKENDKLKYYLSDLQSKNEILNKKNEQLKKRCSKLQQKYDKEIHDNNLKILVETDSTVVLNKKVYNTHLKEFDNLKTMNRRRKRKVKNLKKENERLRKQKDYYKELCIYLNGLTGANVEEITDFNYQLEKKMKN